MRDRAGLAVLLIGGTAFASAASAQPAAPSCGVTAPDVAGLRARIAADRRFTAAGGDPRRETLSSEELQTIWTFVSPAHPAYPAAACQHVVERGGAMQIEREVRCEASAAACAAFTAEIDAIDAGSGDGE